MDDMVNFYTTALPVRPDSRSRLLEEIAYLESRLIDIGHEGDCAYERTLARGYNALLSARRNELAALGV